MTFINYKASAGSGKTYQLVLEYLSLALENDFKFKHILAITFTNKAAAEMKERILRSLKSLSKGENEELKQNLLKKNPSLKNIEGKAGKVLKKVLHNYSNFAVTTIDSFINRLVRSFSYETDIPSGFDVELNFSRMKNFVSKSIFAGIGSDPETTNVIREFVFSKMGQDKSWNVEKNISELQQEINRERTEAPVENIMKIDPGKLDLAAEGLKKIFFQFMEELTEIAKKGSQLITGPGLSLNEFAYKKKGAAAFIEKTSLLNPYQIKVFSGFGDSNFRKGQWMTRNTSDDIRIKIESIADQLDIVQSKMVSLIDEKLEDAITAFLIYENIYLLGLIGKINIFMNEYKDEYNTVPIYELTKKVHGIIKKGDIPFVYYILGDSFENIMIDEFQDTSRMQWDSLFPLVDNSIGEKKISLGVGDEKQSIYRWRGGDMEIMNNDIFELIHPDNLKVINLPYNFRSRENIVNFNNKLFSGLAGMEDHNKLLNRLYKNMDQKGKTGEGGFISVSFLNKEDYLNQALIRTGEIVDECMAAGFTLSDIAILTRKKKEGKEVADYLLSKGIDIITPELLELYKNPLANFFINLLRYIFDNENKLAMTEILFYISGYFKGNIWTINETEKYSTDPGSVSLPGCIDEFIKKRNLLLRLPLYEAVEELIRTFDLHKQLRSASSGYITSFLNMILDYSENEGGGIPGFLEWWEVHNTEYSVPTPENKDGVRIMTIHKAKGLQFPVVFIPFADWSGEKANYHWMEGDGFKAGKDNYPPPFYVHGTKSLESSRFQKEWEEEKMRAETDDINLFYVACTRAIEGLFILSRERKKDNNKVDNYSLLRIKTSSGDMEKSGEDHFTLGKLKKKSEIKETGRVKTINEDKMISNRWSEKITIRERSEKFWNLTPEDHLRKIDKGIIIHEILSQISRENPVDKILHQLLYSGRISGSEHEEIKRDLNLMFEKEEVKGWFFGPGEILSEKAIITEEGIFRPDRVIIYEKRATIIDFKTGKESETNLDQMSKYIEQVKTMGYENVEGILFYIPDGKAVRV
ncbi:MAG: UvrD-helicase domain-containing protein [Acidobacteriota bacterium]